MTLPPPGKYSIYDPDLGRNIEVVLEPDGTIRSEMSGHAHKPGDSFYNHIAYAVQQAYSPSIMDRVRRTVDDVLPKAGWSPGTGPADQPPPPTERIKEAASRMLGTDRPKTEPKLEDAEPKKPQS